MPIDGAVAVADTGAGGGFGGDTGAGDGGDVGDGGDTGSLGDGTGTGDGAGDGDGSGGEPEYEIDEATGETKLDDEGNPVPKAITNKPEPFKATYEKIKAADPKAAEAFRKDHFGYEKYKQIFPTTAVAAQAKEAIENYGGIEGIEALSTTAQQFASEMEQFSQGDPKFLEQLQKDDPAGFSKSISSGLQLLGKTDSAAYTAALAPIVHSSLASAGIISAMELAGNTISQVFKVLEASGGDQKTLFALNKAFDALDKAYGYTENIKKLAEQSADRPLSDKEKQLQQKEQQLTEKERNSFTREVSQTIVKSTDGIINSSLAAYFKQFPKLTKDQRADLHDGVFKHIAAQLDSNKKYKTQLQALLREGDIAKVNNFVSQNVKKIAQASSKVVWNRRGFGSIPNQKRDTNQGGKDSPVLLTRKPKHEDVDWSKTSDIDFMQGSAVLKGTGKRVKFNWNSVQ